MIINKVNNLQQPKFNGAIDGAATTVLRTLDTNPMVNAVGIDLFAMVAPRTYIDNKERNSYAAAETFIREFSGTLIVCLSASYIAKAISYFANKFVNPSVPINPKSWFSNASVAYLKESWDKNPNTKDYVSNVFNNLTGKDNSTTNKMSDVDWKSIEWVDEKRWSEFNWDNYKFKNIHEKLKDKNSIMSMISELIDDKTISKWDSKQLQEILEMRLTNALKADKVSGEINNKTISSSIRDILRDTIDMGRDVLTNTKVNPNEAIAKILKINKIKSLGAIGIAASMGLANQYVNRKITEKRTGTKGFVGDMDYKENVTHKKSTKDKSNGFLTQKLLASLGMAAMAIGVMKIKSPKDFVKKLELTGPVTSGNAIKTVYASTLIGRFLASDNKSELKETVVRDYFGFLNWLVLGGFAAKGVANILDKNRQNLFNISSEGKGIKHWLNEISLKSHNEIAAQGKEFAKKNMWKMNVAHVAGLAYSTLMLGVLLPKLNVYMNKQSHKNTTKTA